MTRDFSNPHEVFFKYVFREPEISRQFFRGYLPANLADQLDFENLHAEEGTFVDERFCDRHSDLLFRAAARNGKRVWLYLVFEHQSTPDPDMPFRVLRYLVRIWERYRERHPGEHPLPFIAPVVLYHGKIPWTPPLQFSRALDMRGDMGLTPTEMEHVLVDLARIPDQLLKERLDLEIALSLMRHIHDHDFMEPLRWILPLLTELRRRKNGIEYIGTILEYIYHVRSNDEWDELIDLLHHADPVIEEMAMTTIAERFIQQGEAIGLEQGVQQGILSEAHDVLWELLEEQFGVLPQSLSDRLETIRSHGMLRMLRRQRRNCQTLEEFEALLTKALQ
jgi:predicted transposase/invertase (TIGR01784 family)